MRCPNCGNEIADNAKFCGKCGGKIQGEMPVINPQMEQSVTNNVQPASPNGNIQYNNVANNNQNYNQPNMNYNPNNQYNPNLGNQVRYNQPVRKKSGFVKLVVLAVLVVACYFGYKEVEKRFLLPIGTWKSADTPIEMKFLEDGELQMGVSGTYAGNMKWKKTSGDTYYISGEVPEVLGISLGEIGCEANFDWKNKKLTVNFGFGEYTFDKED